MNRVQPSRAIIDRVQSIDVVRSGGGEASVLPSTCAVLGFQLHGGVRAGEQQLSPAGVTGIQKQMRQYAYRDPTTSILVRFTPQGAACLGVPASQLATHSVALEDLLPRARARELQERVAGAGSVTESVSIVESFLAKLPFTADPAVERALDLLEASGADQSLVASVARAVSLSERQLERRFLERVGITPKRFASLRRFERAIELAGTAPSLTAVALDAGYYDQSHFIREFHRFAGTTPGALLRARR